MLDVANIFRKSSARAADLLTLTAGLLWQD